MSTPELLSELLAIAEDVELPIDAEVHERPEIVAGDRADASWLAVLRGPGGDEASYLALRRRAEASTLPTPVGLVGAPRPELDLLRELGLAAVDDVGPFVALLALLVAGGPEAGSASARSLPPLDRLRLPAGGSERSGGRLRRGDGGLLRYEGSDGRSTALGRPSDVAAALRSLRETHLGARSSMPRVEGVDRQAVVDVILGPRRALSDPASKAALDPYDLPLPLEELCQSPSRAASEGARIGFPVRIALASPELRPSEHPDLVADGVDSASRARDVYRQLVTLAENRAPHARVLGVTVSATTTARALLRVDVRNLDEELVEARIAFADPHGRESRDATVVVVPASAEAIERALVRLSGAGLLLEGTPGERRAVVTAIGDVLLRLAAFVHDFRREVEGVSLDPLAVLVGGGVEVREACVRVSDAFAQSLSDPDAHAS